MVLSAQPRSLKSLNKDIEPQLTKLQLGFMKDIMSIIGVDCANMVKTLVIENIDQITWSVWAGMPQPICRIIERGHFLPMEWFDDHPLQRGV